MSKTKQWEVRFIPRIPSHDIIVRVYAQSEWAAIMNATRELLGAVRDPGTPHFMGGPILLDDGSDPPSEQFFVDPFTGKVVDR